MPKQAYSPDFLALNPDLAAKLKRSKAVTPDGEGHHGHVPDAQRYEQRTDLLALYRSNVRNMPGLLAYHADEFTAQYPGLSPALYGAIGALERLKSETERVYAARHIENRK